MAINDAAIKAKLIKICNDPVLWAKTFLKTVDNATKKIGPWSARWYQAKMLRDKSDKRVARCGRRTGKTETMCIDALYNTNVHQHYRYLFVAPYERQIEAIFNRLNELIDESPLLVQTVERNTRSPFNITFKNHAAIMGFTTGARSGSAGASLRGQKADTIAIDESDYMADADFDAVLAIAAERQGIKIFLSSTPTGARKMFYKCCTDPNMHFKEFYFPSTCNPQWCDAMEAEFRAILSETGYIHEVLAEFGPQDNGVFNKEKVDKALTYDMYTYEPLTYIQKQRVKDNEWVVDTWIPSPHERMFKPNVFRCMGVDWDTVQATPSLLILDYDISFKKFRVIQRYSVPKVEYTLDAAVNMIIKYNDIYNPSYIYIDRGAGQYQIETLHKYGDEHPESGLKNKIKGWSFANVIEVLDPVTGVPEKKPMKPFMVNQLSMAIERDNLILSPFDEILHKQLIDYEVVRVSANGNPVYSDKNEHFVDCLGLAFLAFALEFPDIAKTTYKTAISSPVKRADVFIGKNQAKALLDSNLNGNKINNPWIGKNGTMSYADTIEDGGEGPKVFPTGPIARNSFNNLSSMDRWAMRSNFSNIRNRNQTLRKMW
jgi:replicative DNA helicase